jgi:hypothetical protein
MDFRGMVLIESINMQASRTIKLLTFAALSDAKQVTEQNVQGQAHHMELRLQT